MPEEVGVRRAPVLLLALFLTGCPADTRVAIEDGSTLSSLTFAVSDSRDRPTALSMFVVESCRSIFYGSGDVFWMLEAGDGPEELTRLRYGVRPPGYLEVHVARTLPVDACYAVTFGGADELYFVAGPVGELSVVTEDEAQHWAAR